MADDQSGATRGISRRRFLGAAAATTGAAVLGGVVGFRAADQLGPPVALGSGARIIDFHGTHQAGIVTPAQDRLTIAAFDMVTSDRAALVAMLRLWSAAADRMTRGLTVGDAGGAPDAPPADTGDALDLLPAGLTLTLGFGPSLFDGRFGLASSRPAALADIPPFRFDDLDPDRSNGDIVVQACADDPQVAFHAIRNLARLGRGTVVLRWLQQGFGRTSSTSSAQATPRNLMGFKDGTNNIVAEDTAGLAQFVWADGSDQSWMRDGTFMVVRRIRMRIETWDRTALGEQETVIGRSKLSGAPLGGRAEHDTVDLAAKDAAGDPVIPADAHIRLAAPASNSGARILRRGYSFTDGIDPVTGQLDAGLFFIAFQRDPRTQFVAIQRQLSTIDTLNEYIEHVASGVYACPPGVANDGWWGQSLLG